MGFKIVIKSILRILLFIFSFLGISAGADNECYAQHYSQIWGRNGEKWDRSRIPDFTTSGYKEGKVLIPSYPIVINIREMGAFGDGIHDDTYVLREAIKNCGKKGTVFLPAGSYLITDSILIEKSGLSIRGAGRDKTILLISKGLEELYPRYGLNGGKQSPWSWSGSMITFQGNISGSGIESLSIRFPDSLWSDHNFHERGYNGIGFSGNAQDGWISNVHITGSDLGIWIDRSAHHITITDWLLDFGPNRNLQKIQGHHGVNIYGGYNLLQNFEIRGRFWHDLSVESKFSTHNVFRKGKGTDLCLDHHHHEHNNNLFTDLDAGEGGRLYFSGGNFAPLGICFNETFWNIRAKSHLKYCDEKNSDKGRSTNNVCVGFYTDLPSQLNNPDGNWFETIQPSDLYPKDLYKAQMDFKLRSRH
ncbi:glycosyl hydrolase family 28-related protein [Pedobacter sp. R-06]|uniref:glycosyl hydrolase family 28-related protein n=1 Tax=Pedobacter sp. R-06 TaxID=3404051 RepID=UPI003CF1760E